MFGFRNKIPGVGEESRKRSRLNYQNNLSEVHGGRRGRGARATCVIGKLQKFTH